MKLLRNVYTSQEATVRTGHGTTGWFQIRKGVHQGCILLPCLFNLYAEYIMQNAWMDETQARIKIAGRNINNLRYADNTTVMAECKEELKSLLISVVMCGCESWIIKKAECWGNDVLNWGVGEDSWESLGLQGNPTSVS